MRRGIRRTIVVCTLAGGALLIAIVTILIGTWPYERPSIALEPGGEDASFDGVGQLITDASLHGPPTARYGSPRRSTEQRPKLALSRKLAD